ncbi:MULTISPECIES: rod shape-determining protein MreD [Clostridium]|jgi:rod shape-determining protein MreD|uniref:Rod shape-determining protein MreD n=4 Tax=Clostridium TaxID=1485 RepID=A0A0B5Q8G2_CLOBE|nr:MULTISPECIES: rod shape-determining protein MreD [Clostridium]ABR32681.1 rod shape-determining protein MreD [Clostridium beijerinckii NCIMB 8052]AIU01136.1 rod shape-determining protein MreD [Clostridium beijerinckii ATCC 35702]AJG97200.1 rod shape-determining protein MreD [Clostridium beijerinckii]ALB48157.1 rod shape-determining protein MreD [Clostridium beijerinckii NRRL B-598]AQS03121.1 rod shape-determining protein MreD [Clostridium beijerinckii]
MEKLIIILISIGLVILDNSLIPFFSIKGAYPSLLFTFAIAYSLVNKKERAVFMGVVSGILQDIFFFNGFGVNSLLNLFLCLLASFIGAGIIKTKRLIPVISAFFITIIKYAGVMLIFNFFNIEIQFSKSIIMGVYNGVIMFFVYKLVMNVYDDEYSKQRWRFR